jgi:hypothetical protein
MNLAFISKYFFKKLFVDFDLLRGGINVFDS